MKHIRFIFATILMFTVCPYTEGISVRGWSNFDITAGNTDNLYRTSTAFSDTLSNLAVILGAKTVFSPKFYCNTSYRLDNRMYGNYTSAKYSMQSISEEVFSSLFNDTIEFNFTGTYDYFLQPERTTYDFTGVYLSPEIKAYFTDELTLSLSYIYQQTDYPLYNLDNLMTGYFMSLGYDLSLFNSMKLYAYSYHKPFLEYHLYQTSDGTTSSLTRTDENIGGTLYYTTIILFGQVSIKYNYDSLISNGDYLHYGTDKTYYTDDEFIISDYNSYSAHKFGIGYGIYTLHPFIFNITGDIQSVNYRQRHYLNSDNLYSTDIQRDTVSTLSMSFGYIITDFGDLGKLRLNLRYDYETLSSNNPVAGYSNNIITSSLSGWFW
ncbi:MAG: hypothetical protein WC955_09695 [Elusimicrobiota bacterium]